MIRRIDKIKSDIPIWFVYGSRSWIDYTAGYSAVYIRQSFFEDSQISVEVYIEFNFNLEKLLFKWFCMFRLLTERNIMSMLISQRNSMIILVLLTTKSLLMKDT